MLEIYSDPVAQSVEQHPFKVMVAGSIPARVTLYLMNNQICIAIFYLLLSSCIAMDDNRMTLNETNLQVKKEFQNEQLIFIYNASDTFLSVSFDFIHKIISPSTYQCSLCKVTYGNVSMRKEWKRYINSCPFSIEFLYKNNYLKYHKDLKAPEFPIAYKYDGNSYTVFISKEEFDLCNDLDDLIRMITRKTNQ